MNPDVREREVDSNTSYDGWCDHTGGCRNCEHWLEGACEGQSDICHFACAEFSRIIEDIDEAEDANS